MVPQVKLLQGTHPSCIKGPRFTFYLCVQSSFLIIYTVGESMIGSCCSLNFYYIRCPICSQVKQMNPMKEKEWVSCNVLPFTNPTMALWKWQASFRLLNSWTVAERRLCYKLYFHSKGYWFVPSSSKNSEWGNESTEYSTQNKGRRPEAAINTQIRKKSWVIRKMGQVHRQSRAVSTEHSTWGQWVTLHKSGPQCVFMSCFPELIHFIFILILPHCLGP